MFGLTVVIGALVLLCFKYEKDSKRKMFLLFLEIGIIFVLFLQIIDKSPELRYQKMNEELVLFDFYIDVEQHPDLESWTFVNDFEFLYTCGDDMEDYLIECSIMELLNRLPRTFEKFLKDGGQMIMGYEKFFDVVRAYTNSTFEETLSGVYFKDELNNYKPTICVSYKDYASDDILSFFVWGMTEIHELAHYMDDRYGFSATDDFKEYFVKYAADYEPKCPVIKDYQMKSEKEFFAILVTDIIKTSDIETLNLSSDLYDYMRGVFMIAERIDISEE